MYCRKPQRARSDFMNFFQRMERMAENLTRIGNHNEPSVSSTPWESKISCLTKNLNSKLTTDSTFWLINCNSTKSQTVLDSTELATDPQPSSHVIKTDKMQFRLNVYRLKLQSEQHLSFASSPSSSLNLAKPSFHRTSITLVRLDLM